MSLQLYRQHFIGLIVRFSTIDRMGLDNFVAEMESRLGYKLQPAKEFKFTSNVD